MKTITLNLIEGGVTDYFTILRAERRTCLTFADRKFTMSRGDLILSRENIRWNCDAGSSLSVLSIRREFFDGLFVSQTADCRIIYDFIHDESGNSEYLYFSCQNDQNVLIAFNALEQELKLTDSHHEKMTHLLMVAIVTELDRARENSLIVPNSTMVSQNRFGKLMKYMGDHYNECTLSEVAEKYGYNPDYLSFRFKMITGVTFSKKMLEMKLEQAANMLLSSELTSDEIAQSCGFQSRSWFTRKFKERFGESPGKWRKNSKKLA